MISMERKYRTLDGRPVELISDKGRCGYPFVGYIGNETGLRRWDIRGRTWRSDESFAAEDIVEVEPLVEEKIEKRFPAGGVFDVTLDNFSDALRLLGEAQIELRRLRAQVKP